MYRNATAQKRCSSVKELQNNNKEEEELTHLFDPTTHRAALLYGGEVVGQGEHGGVVVLVSDLCSERAEPRQAGTALVLGLEQRRRNQKDLEN
jgi:hypothetical protein